MTDPRDSEAPMSQEQYLREVDERKREAHKMAMSIPAQPDHDPDLVIGDSLRDIPKLLAIIKEYRDTLDLCDPRGDRARLINAPEDAVIKSLCEAIGYGAVIDSAARQWQCKDPFGAFTCGPGAGTVRKALDFLPGGEGS